MSLLLLLLALQTAPDPEVELAGDVYAAERAANARAKDDQRKEAEFTGWVLEGDPAKGRRLVEEQPDARGREVLPVVVGLSVLGGAVALGLLGALAMLGFSVALVTPAVLRWSSEGITREVSPVESAQLGASFWIAVSVVPGLFAWIVTSGLLVVLPALDYAGARAADYLRGHVREQAAQRLAPESRPPLNAEQQRKLIALAAAGAERGGVWSGLPVIGSWVSFRQRRDVVDERVQEAVRVSGADPALAPRVMEFLQWRARAQLARNFALLFGGAAMTAGVPLVTLGMVALSTAEPLRAQLTAQQHGTLVGAGLLMGVTGGALTFVGMMVMTGGGLSAGPLSNALRPDTYEAVLDEITPR